MNEEKYNEIWNRLLSKKEHSNSVYIYSSARERIEETAKSYNEEYLKARDSVDYYLKYMEDTIGEGDSSKNIHSPSSQEGHFLSPYAPDSVEKKQDVKIPETKKALEKTTSSTLHPWKNKRIRRIIITE